MRITNFPSWYCSRRLELSQLMMYEHGVDPSRYMLDIPPIKSVRFPMVGAVNVTSTVVQGAIQ